VEIKIAADKNQFAGSHGLSNAAKHIQIEQMGHEIVPIPLLFGDYCVLNERMEETITRRGKKLCKADTAPLIDVSVDSKKDIQEIIGNICGKSHNRFRDELIKAKDHNCKFYILIENKDGVKTIDDLDSWENPRKVMTRWITTPNGKRVKAPISPSATPGYVLAKAMRTMEKKYLCKFLFCTTEDAGPMILKLLGVEGNHGE